MITLPLSCFVMLLCLYEMINIISVVLPFTNLIEVLHVYSCVKFIKMYILIVMIVINVCYALLFCHLPLQRALLPRKKIFWLFYTPCDAI